MFPKDHRKMCGNCANSVIHLPIQQENFHMFCLKWIETTNCFHGCTEFKHQNEVNYFHTWNEKERKPNTIYYELKDLDL